MRSRCACAVATGVLLVAAATAARAQTMELATTVTDVKFTRPDGGGGLEGPACSADGTLYFTDRNNDRILKLAPDGSTSTFRQPAGHPNGLVFDSQMRLLSAESGDRETKMPARITRTDLKTGRVEVLADRYEGADFGGPNDLTYDGRGRIYFTVTGANTVYRLDTDGKLTRILAAPAVSSPNGIMVSLDDRTLYLTEANRGANGARTVRAFNLSPEGTPSNPRVVRDFSPGRGGDGMAIDREGNLYVAAGLDKSRVGSAETETLDTKAGAYVYSPSGKLLKYLAIPMGYPTNVAFCGPDLKTLYATTSNRVFKAPVQVAGTRR